jgi:hypothetical protein
MRPHRVGSALNRNKSVGVQCPNAGSAPPPCLMCVDTFHRRLQLLHTCKQPAAVQGNPQDGKQEPGFAAFSGVAAAAPAVAWRLLWPEQSGAPQALPVLSYRG